MTLAFECHPETCFRKSEQEACQNYYNPRERAGGQGKKHKSRKLMLQIIAKRHFPGRCSCHGGRAPPKPRQYETSLIPREAQNDSSWPPETDEFRTDVCTRPTPENQRRMLAKTTITPGTEPGARDYLQKISSEAHAADHGPSTLSRSTLMPRRTSLSEALAL